MSFVLPVNITVILSFTIFVFYLLGLHQVITSFQKNDCEMTFMFQYPQFVEINLPPDVEKSFPKYRLYGYSEGSFTEQLRKKKFKGIPVLFIPGSIGSFKQGRSIASISLRKSVNSRTPFHFNYFMVDFNEELSGLYGAVLRDQSKFVLLCINNILKLYKNNEGSKPSSVILIGHSIGGLHGKAIFLHPELDPKSVSIIISLSTPHKYPVIQFDHNFKSYYNDIHNLWQNNLNLSHVSMISLGGGHKDVLVNSDTIFDKSSTINALTTAIPGVWLPNDHLSILWCKQLILTVVRAIFDVVDPVTKQVTTDKNYINSVFNYHLIKRSGSKSYFGSQTSQFATFEKSQFWFENLQRQFTVTEPQGVKANHYIMIRLFSDPKSEVAFVEAYNVNVRDWIFVCSADVIYNSIRMCENGENLSNMTEIAPVNPKLKLKRKFVFLNLLELKDKLFTHVVIKLPPSTSFMSVNVDIYQESERHINYTVPKIYSMSSQTILENTKDNALAYTISLVGFEHIWQSYTLKLLTLSCKTSKNQAVLSFIVPWSNESQHFIFGDENELTTTLSLITPKPKHFVGGASPLVKLHLDPTCKYQMKIQISVTGIFAQGARFYSFMLPAFLGAIGLLTLRQQMINLDEGRCILYQSALSSAVRRYYIVHQAAIFGSKLLSFSFWLSIFPIPDFVELQERNFDPFFFTILLYGVGVMLMYAAGAACYLAVVLSGQAAHKMAIRFVAKTVSGIVNWSEWVISALHQLPIFVSVMLVSFSLSTCGAVALWLGVFFYFLKLCKMYEEYLEEWFNFSIKLIAKTVKKAVTKNTNQEPHVESTINNESSMPTAEEQNTEADLTVVNAPEENTSTEEVDLLSAIHFHTSVFLIWLMLAGLQIPALLMWAKNYHYSVSLEGDPSLLSGITASVCGAVLWRSDVPKINRRYSKVTSAILYIAAIVCIVYSTSSLFRLGSILSAGLLVLSVNQILAP